MTSVINQVAFLRTSREFPEELHQLSMEVNRSYLDIANAVNNRTISLFPVNRPAINGESWFLSGNLRQQGLRQVYQFTTSASIPHGLNLNRISFFTRPFGSFTDGTNYYGCLYASNVAIAGQLTFYIDPTNIVFVVGAGSPAIVNGIIVLEWISDP